ncbi:hypothetical protein PF005_g69 [Phytophthora fragariae]|uniref:RxLR effector protein n=1 Tax=Phytophthora fragariae TaxID=53985 RepID=A0A6A3UV90_9STRA|nr:hypothetical protein PF003_g32527 [Phytophthora fragariae]KAE8950345.1 hypothetical protein PF009_g67 [Phytophthora fragariae]KAE9031460.1 hypothetical protein PF011_g58 [Phytophthora fragariae]KAE9141705.1 hypothetical protein PF007_g4 [Phytophthora fragariae]KAE9155967.1 hypothetical protein PF006_g67 [Phytophthora fragariae]
MIRVVLVVFVAIMPWVLLLLGPSPWSPSENEARSSWRTMDVPLVSVSMLNGVATFEWRKLLRWWNGRRELALTLDTWPEPEIDMDECLARYRDSKHNEVCVISS